MGPAIWFCISSKDPIFKHLFYSLLEKFAYLNTVMIKSPSLKEEHGNRANMTYTSEGKCSEVQPREQVKAGCNGKDIYGW